MHCTELTYLPLQRTLPEFTGGQTPERGLSPKQQAPSSADQASQSPQDSDTTLQGLALLQPQLRTPGPDREQASHRQNHPEGSSPLHVVDVLAGPLADGEGSRRNDMPPLCPEGGQAGTCGRGPLPRWPAALGSHT